MEFFLIGHSKIKFIYFLQLKVFDEQKIKSCLENIFNYNVMQYADGRAGAVNGMRPNGKVDITSMQSEEVWIGVNDALASLMIYEVRLYF